MNEVPVLIIGAGPAGLAIAGRLRKQGIQFELLEKSERIANVWHEHYDRLHLHTVKELSHLPHLPFPDDYPRYVPRQKLVAYYEHYAQKFDIRPHFGEEVTALNKSDTGWVAHTATGQSWKARYVVVAVGVNRAINRPVFPGEATFQGRILHSRLYKNATFFLGQRVLVVGMGNTGAEIALDLCEQGVSVGISVRSPVNIVPRDTFAGPTQRTALMLSKLPNGLGDWLGTQLRRLMVGDLSRYGLPTPNVPPAKQLRTTGKTPVIDIGTVAQIKAGNIKVFPAIQHFEADGVVFVNGEKQAFDTVLLATGYLAQFEDFIENANTLLDAYGWPKSCIAEGAHEGLYFLGYDNYVAGGILGVIYRDSETIAKDITAKLAGVAAPV